MPSGKIIKSTGSWYSVLQQNGETIDCRLKGQFKIKGIKHTNPLAVGDNIEFEKLANENIGLIHRLLDRKNYIIRKSTNLSKQTHILASNIDVAVLMITISKPRTSTGFIDRFLLSAEAYHIPSILIFNKIDIYEPEEKIVLEKYKSIYEKINYKCFEVSAIKELGIDELMEYLQNKVALMAGHSGVGKSTLLNAINPSLKLKTSNISDFHQKGTHTTTFAEMHHLKGNTWIIDTPGIKEFGVIDFASAHEVSEYFMEMLPYLQKCKFGNCSHTIEKGCAVIEALNNGEIDPERYKNYLQIIDSLPKSF